MTWQWAYSAAILAVSFAAIAFSFLLRGERARGLLISFSITFAMLAASDLYFRSQGKSDLFKLVHPPGYSSQGEILGRRPPPPGQYRLRAVTKISEETIYDVLVTIGQHRFRETRSPGPNEGTILFFGGSYTFGTGVADSETYPAQFSKELNDRYRVLNMGFAAYGPHQMLRILESGLADDAIERPVAGAYYLAIQNHSNRAAGLQRWNQFSPRYVLDDTGELYSDGLHADNSLVRLRSMSERQGGLPAVISLALTEALFPLDERIEITAAIIQRSADLVREKYGVELYCLLWDTRWAVDIPKLQSALQLRGVKTLRVSDFVEDLDAPTHRILPGIETHPNSAFHVRFGKALAAHYISTPNYTAP